MMKKQITIALAGNANVGKSVIFNQLTGGNQIIGNWPGKTVEVALKVAQNGVNGSYLKYGKEVEERIEKLMASIKGDFGISKRFLAIKLLEHDTEVEKLTNDENIIKLRDELAKELEDLHGENIQTIIIQERYALATLTLIFGVLRKELTLIMLATFYHTSNFSLVLTPKQIFIYGFVTMIYIPCIATIAMLKREFGTKNCNSYNYF